MGKLPDHESLRMTQLEPSQDIVFTCGAAIGGAAQ
jgi:hypothetical protein